MRGDIGSLYDAHATRLYAYCWSLVGDEEAAAAVGDTFVAAVHQPPRGDSVLWLYSLSRTACAERDAFGGQKRALFVGADPLLRAAGALRSDHREVLLLWAGEWLEPHDIARVLGIAPDTAAQLLNAARTRLERAVLDTLMRGTPEPHLELITAFEKGRLPQLLARRAPAQAPGRLREQVLAACEEEAARPLPSVVAPSPLVLIGQGDAARDRRPKRGLSGGISKGLGVVAGLAASAAAVVGLLVSWPAAKGGGAASLAPTAGGGRTQPASTGANADRTTPPGFTGSERSTAGARPGSSGNPVTGAYDTPPQPAGTAPDTGGGAPVNSTGRPPDGKSPSNGTPSKPGTPSQPGTPSKPGTPTTSPPTDPTTPPDEGSGAPTDPTTPPDTPTDPPSDPGAPSPTTNPTPSPEG